MRNMEKGKVFISKYGISLKLEWSDTKGGYQSAVRQASGKVFRDIDEVKEFFAWYARAGLRKAEETAKGKAMAFKMAFSKTEYLAALEKYAECIKNGSPDTFLWKYVIDHFESCFTPEVLDSCRKEMRLSVRRMATKPGRNRKNKKEKKPEKAIPSNGSYKGTAIPMPAQGQVAPKELSAIFDAFKTEHGTGLPLEWHEIDAVTHLVVQIGRMTLPIPASGIVCAREVKRNVPTFSISCKDGFTYHLKLFGGWKLKTFNRNPVIKMKK